MKTLNRLNSMDEGDELGKVFVGGLSWETTTASLQKYFMQYGALTDCVVMKNQLTGRSRGFGFVTFEDPSLLGKVLTAKQPHIIDNRQVDPKPCNPRSMNTGGKSVENNKRKVFIGGLPSDVTDQQLKEMMSKYGPVIDAVIMFDHARQKTRGFGFVTFENEDSVSEVCKQQYLHVKDKQVEVKRAEPREVHSVADKSHLLPLPVTSSSSSSCANSSSTTPLLARIIRQQQLQPQLQQILATSALHNQQPQTQGMVSPNYSLLTTIMVQSAEVGGGYPPSPAAAASAPPFSAYTCPPPSSLHPLAAAAAAAAPITPYPQYQCNGSTVRQPQLTDYAQQAAAAGGYITTVPQYQPTAGYLPPPGAAAATPAILPATEHNPANQPGLLGSYPAGGGGGAVMTGGVDTTTGGTGGAYMNFSPQVTYTLTPGMTPVPGSMVMPAPVPPPQPPPPQQGEGVWYPAVSAAMYPAGDVVGAAGDYRTYHSTPTHIISSSLAHHFTPTAAKPPAPLLPLGHHPSSSLLPMPPAACLPHMLPPQCC